MTTFSSAIPRFYLYGEPHQVADARFVHVESLADRSRPSEWTIRPHAHADLNHLFHIVQGGGSMRAEEASLAFAAPCLILVPAGIVHGFQWASESAGNVITVSTDYLDRLRQSDASLARIFSTPAVAMFERADSKRFEEKTADLKVELAWAAPGHRAAAEAGLLNILVGALRALGAQEDVTRSAPGRHAALVARFREQVEERFRMREPIAVYTRILRTSSTRLRVACSAVAGLSPLQILDQRAVVEAQRLLLYSNLPIVEVAESIGLPDAAYFSRFFTRHVGVAPSAYRSERLGR